MRNFLIILAAFVGLTAFGATNEPSIQMLATTNGVVKLPTNITSIRIGGTVFTNLLGFGLAVSNNQLSIDTTQLPAGGGGGGSGTVTSVGASTTVSGLGFSGSPVTSSGTLSLTGVVAVASGGTGASDASGARTALSLVPGTNVQAWDADLDDLADGSLTGSKVGSGIDDDNVSFDDADSLWTATTIGAALEELNDSINAGVPNGTGAKLHWSQLLGVPAGFADGSDDGSGGGSGTMTGISFVVPGPFSISPTSTTTTNTFTLSVSNQTANTVWAGPTSGGAAAPTFRALVDDDVPNTITVDLATTATTANAGDSATAFFSSGTIEEARIDSTIARDSEVTAATAEATLESVLDLQDLQGAVTDAQVPNTITIDQATLALTGDSATSFFSTGEIEDARLPSGLTRDAEAAATYAPLASPALTGSPTVPTASAGTSNTVAASTAYVDRAVSLGGGSGTWDGTPIANGTVTNLTVETLNGDEVWSAYNGDIWAEGEGYGAYSDVFYPHWYGFAIASGLPLSQIATTNNPSVTPIGASANSNSGYSYAAGTTSEDIGGGGKLFIAKGAFSETNLVVGRCGFQDSVSATEPVDGAYLRWANGYLYGVLRNNSSETTTATSNLLAASSTTYYELRTRVNDDAASVTFYLRQATAPMVFTTVWTDSVTNTLPTGSSRLTGHGITVYRTTGSAGLGLFNLDALGKKNIRRPVR